MRIHVIAVGKARQGPEKALFDHFCGRISAWAMVLREVEIRGRVPSGKLKAAEAEKLAAALPARGVVVALDETGRQDTSMEFAHCLGAWQDDGVADLAFVIGGADGLDTELRNRADLRLSLGRATWPHMLVRGMLAEQIYRAQQILSGHPYHRN